VPFLGLLRLTILLKIRAIAAIVFTLEDEASVECYGRKRPKDQ